MVSRERNSNGGSGSEAVSCRRGLADRLPYLEKLGHCLSCDGCRTATRGHSRASIRRQKPDTGFCVILSRMEIRSEMQGMAAPLVRRNRFVTWAVVHLFAIAAWLRIASPLWQLSQEERCPDFGDSLYFLIWVLPTLAVGTVAGIWGLTRACFSADQVKRSRRICFWTLILVAWLTAAGVVYVKVRQDAAIPCGG
jgi:hypothetical protein